MNPAAETAGLRPGQALATAQAINSDFVTVEYDPASEARWRDFLAAWAYRYSSEVSTELPCAIVLEIRGSLSLFGPWPILEKRLRDELRQLAFRHRIVAAPNPFAARVLANSHDGLGVDENVLQTALGQLSVERASLTPDVAQAFSRMGLRRLRQVFALPRDALARRFPKTVLAHLDAMRGEAPTPLNYYRPPDKFDQRIEFEQEVESSQALLFPLRRLSADLAAFLSGRDGGVQRFSLHLEHERCADTLVEVGLLAPERGSAMLFELANGRLEQAKVPAPVRGLRLVARDLPPFVPAERDLFDQRAQQAVPWDQLRERLRARLGDDAVHSLTLQGDHRPEHAWSPNGRSTPLPATLQLRPGWLLAESIPLRGHGLKILAGPERIESGWWDGEVRRDYYLIETAEGQRAWAYCGAGERGPFMLHGWFA